MQERRGHEQEKVVELSETEDEEFHLTCDIVKLTSNAGLQQRYGRPKDVVETAEDGQVVGDRVEPPVQHNRHDDGSVQQHGQRHGRHDQRHQHGVDGGSWGKWIVSAGAEELGGGVLGVLKPTVQLTPPLLSALDADVGEQRGQL